METIHIFYSEKEWSPTSSITSLGSIFRAINTRHGWWEVGVAVKVSWSFDTYLAWFQILDSRFYHSRLAYIYYRKNKKFQIGHRSDHRFWIRIWDPIWDRSLKWNPNMLSKGSKFNSESCCIFETRTTTRDTRHITRYQPNVIGKGNTRWLWE